jgi:magnesium chelatase family protein
MLKDSVNSIARPFCSPHHTASPAAIVGGGSTVRPGQISLAHRGVLFLDEFPEFARNVLEALRQPLEDGVVSVARASGTLTLPAKFMLVAAMNPCPCGNLGDPGAICICTPTAVVRYGKRVSGPLMDRMDIQVQVVREKVSEERAGADISMVRSMIARAREQQWARLSPVGLVTNSELSHKNIDRLCGLHREAERLLVETVNRSRLSLRAYHKVKKVARTIADLDGSEPVDMHHVAEALTLRIREREPADGGLRS